MKKNLYYLLLPLIAVLCSCSKDDDETSDKDMTPPAIEGAGDVTSPINCQIYGKGDVIPFRYTFTDNRELGKFNIEIHNNFDHHTHSTDAGDCQLDPKKEPEYPWIYNQDYSILEGSKSYEAQVDIPIPEDIDTGDYHFMIRVTDKTGWQQLKAVSLKIQEKKEFIHIQKEQ